MSVETLTPQPRQNSRRRSIPPELLRRPDAAAYCGVGTSTWDRLAASGKTPAPIKLGGSPVWSITELSSWVAAGCPDRATWIPMWAELQRRNAKR